jgi:glycosyltransferase involved in cell wall biosynthesis
MQKFGLGKKTGFAKKCIRKGKSIFYGCRDSGKGFWVYSPFSLPVHHMEHAKAINDYAVRKQVQIVARNLGIVNPLMMVVCPGACDIALRMRYDKLVYLRTDAYELFPNVDQDVIMSYDRRLKAEADLTLFVSRKLFDSEKDQCRGPYFLDHGVDYELFASSGGQEPPADIRDIPHPIVGFFGTLDGHTVDVELCGQLADLLPEYSFVFVGRVAKHYEELHKENVFLLGMKEYEQIPTYGNCFDVCIMPWRQTEWIHACNPIKLKEYLALGKPVVSTPFDELAAYRDVIYEATGPERFAECIRVAIDGNCLERLVARREKVREATWDTKVASMIEQLYGKDGGMLENGTSG